MGSQVPSLTHVSKSPLEGKVPSSGPQDTIKIGIILVKVGSSLFHAKKMHDLCLGFWLDPTLDTSPTLVSKKCCHVTSMSYLGPLWSGESQLRYPQWTRLHGLTSSDLGPRTRDRRWVTGPNLEGPSITKLDFYFPRYGLSDGFQGPLGRLPALGPCVKRPFTCNEHEIIS